MDVSAALTTLIRDLSGHIEPGSQQTTEAVGALADTLTQAVSSYLGLQLVLMDHGHPVVLTSFDPTAQPDQVAASMRVPLSVLGVRGADPHSAVTFYARTPGAFVDLAADFRHALEPRTVVVGREHGSPRTGITVDGPFLPTTVESGLVGAVDLSTIHRAMGLLIGEGHHPDHAYAELIGRAVAAGSTVLACAAQLVRPSPTGAPEPGTAG